MARLAVLLALFALFATVFASAHELKTRQTPRGHDAIAKRKRASINETDSDTDTAPEPAPAPADDDNTPTSEVVPRGGPRKACVAWSNTIPSSLKRVAGRPNVFGMYTWSPWCPDNTYGIPCFPMLWGYKSIGQFKSLVKKGYSTHALGPNEANQPGQSQMSPGSAASLWRQYMQPLQGKGYKLVSPSVSNAKSGIPWLQSYFKQCSSCKKSTHAVAAHFYGTNVQNFIDYITNVHHATGNMTVWVTEVACTDFSGRTSCDTGHAHSFMNGITAWMDKTPWVEMYCWFGMWHSGKAGVPASNALLNSDGTLNSLGASFFS